MSTGESGAGDVPVTTRRADGAAVLLLAVAALVVRLTGAGALLPHLAEPDRRLTEQVEVLAGARDPDRAPPAPYPTLIPRLAASATADPPRSDALDAHLAAASSPTLGARRVVAALSALAVPATYLLVRHVAGLGPALLAALLLLTSLLAQTFAQQARPHEAAAATSLFAVLAAMRARAAPGWRGTLVLVAAVAVAVGTLPVGLFVLPAVVVAFVLAGRHRGRLALAGLATAGAGAVLGVLAFHSAAPAGGASPGWDRALLGESFPDVRLDGTGLLAVVRWLVLYDPVLAALGGVGLVALAATERVPRPPPDAWVALAFALPYLGVIGLMDAPTERLVLPLVPYVAAVAALGSARLFAALRAACGARAARPARVGALAAAAAVLAIPGWATARVVTLRSRPDTVERAAAWIASRAGPETVVLVHPRLALPLFSSGTSRAYANTVAPMYERRWRDYQVRHGPEAPPGPVHLLPLARPDARTPAELLPRDEASVARLVRTSRASWLVLEVHGRAGTDPVRKAVRCRYPLAARFGSPRPIGRGYQADHDSVAAFALAADVWGPTIEIYRLTGRLDEAELSAAPDR